LAHVIGHLDLDYFYAQVEEVEDPSLREQPVVVCVYSGRTEESGVVSTANYKARELGVKSGIPIALAKKRTEGTNARFIRIDHQRYEVYSEKIMEIIRESVDVMEQTGIDEAFFDITKRSKENYDTATKLVIELKQKILEQEKLTCSAGLAPNKVVAKLASDIKKPDGLTVIRPADLRLFLKDMPVEKLYGIGPKSARILKDRGITKIGDLAAIDAAVLGDMFDRKFAIYLHNAANGTDDGPVVENAAAKQLSRIITLKRNSLELEEIIDQLSPAINDLQQQVIEKGLFFRSISAMGILTDLSIKTRSKTLDAPTSDLSSLKKAVKELFSLLLAEKHELRRAGVKVSDFTEAKTQSSLVDFLR
jgi:DNA polymerase IV (archaeal DinB-like DNA polymerase)